MKPNLPGQLKCGENRQADNSTVVSLFFPICKTRTTLACLLRAYWHCLLFPRGSTAPPREKQADCLFFIKWREGKNSLPGTELFDCADLYASIQGSDDRSQNRERFCFLRVLMTQNPVKGHLKSDRDILSLSSKFAVWISAAYLPVSGDVWNIVPNS